MKIKNEVLKILVLALVFSLLLSGCGRGGEQGEAKIKIGVCLSSFHAGFMTALNQAVLDQGKALGITVNVSNANGDASTQADNMLSYITQGVDAIVINPIDSNGIIPSIQMANKQGIPVFIVDTNAAGGEIMNKNATDHLKAGKTAAENIAQVLFERYGGYKGKVVNLAGKISQASGHDRDKGFMDEISKYPDIEVVFRQDCEFDQEKSMNAMMNALQANSEIDAVFAANDNTALGAVKAIEQAGRSHPIGDPKRIYIVGVDGNPEGLKAIRDGRIDATISQNPITMGKTTIQMAYDYLVNKTTPEAITESPQILITKDNLETDAVKNFGLWADELRSRTGS